MQLSRFADYGIRSLIYLAGHPGRLCTAREIAAYYGVSYHHIVKVTHRLVRLHLIDSRKGKGGGLMLASDAREARLGDLVAKLEPNMDLVECFNPETNHCRISGACRLQGHLHGARRAFIDHLNSRTLADLAPGRGMFEDDPTGEDATAEPRS